jgi:hypothetical protein
MTHQTILDIASKAATKQQQANSRLLKEVEQKTSKLVHAKELAHRAAVQEGLAIRRRKKTRMHTALRGITKLCELGRTPQFQSLIKAHGKPLVFWGGEHVSTPGFDMAACFWKWVSRIELTSAELQISNHVETSGDYGEHYSLHPAVGCFAIELPYDACEVYLSTRPFWSIATDYPIDPIDRYDPRDTDCEDDNFVYSTEKLFEALVECGDSRKFLRLFRRAIAR